MMMLRGQNPENALNIFFEKARNGGVVAGLYGHAAPLWAELNVPPKQRQANSPNNKGLDRGRSPIRANPWPRLQCLRPPGPARPRRRTLSVTWKLDTSPNAKYS